MTKKTDISDEERALFRQHISGAKPVEDEKPLKSSAPTTSRSSKSRQTIMSDAGYFYVNGLQKRTLQDLRDGQLSI